MASVSTPSEGEPAPPLPSTSATSYESTIQNLSTVETQEIANELTSKEAENVEEPFIKEQVEEPMDTIAKEDPSNATFTQEPSTESTTKPIKQSTGQSSHPGTSVEEILPGTSEPLGTDQHIISTEDTPAEPAESLLDIHSHPPM